MNPWIGWGLAALFTLLAWQQYGWQGLLFAFSALTFWLLLQFNKAVRVMRQAGSAPVGYIDSAVMLNAKLHKGLPMIKIVMMTRSLGQKVSDEPQAYRWTDPGGSHVTLELRGGRLVRWTLWRPPSPEEAGSPGP
jgi:hypothetical protein